ncbi:RNA polymerase sigma factor [Asticcacaulis sp. AC402]|uniref:RNA polymerase sigma factor n=1 Tax=Asticcacaulis sp. AC402 TaxID=1282361 RepID=UPI0005917ADE|nr:sigma-70 family RNA polymerase sigma factor [Asticcacaulis sp. AC402]
MRASRERQIWLSRHVIQHEPALRAWLRRRPIVGLDVDDIVQETYARLANVESVDDIHNVKNYMFQAAYSIMMSHVRKSRIVYFREFDELKMVDLGRDDMSPESQTIHRQELSRLLDAVVALPDMIRAVFLARRLKGLSQREAAKALSLPESTIEMRMRRANLLLTKALSEDGKFAHEASREAERATKARSTSDQKTFRT